MNTPLTSTLQASAPGLTRAMVLLFAFCCGAIVANLYYAQPIVELIAPDLGLASGSASLIVSLTQIGYALGLLFLVPLLWPEQHLSEGGWHDAGSSMSTAMIYIFGVWIGLILFSVAFSVAVRLWAVHWTGVGAPTETADVLAMRQPGDDRADDRVDSSPSAAPLPPASTGPEDQL